MDDPIATAAAADDLSRFCCLNPRCADRGRRGAGNLTVCGRYGKHETHRLLYCRTCRARFSERKGTPLFNARLPTAKAVSVLAHLADGCGVRQTGRLTGVSRGAVGRLCGVAGRHAEAVHDERVALSP
jgi:transposase-like protein